MNWEWLKDIGWVGTTLVALGGLAATVWTGRRSGQVQLVVQDRQLAENRRVLEWQERRTAYAQFLKHFQEYFDKSIIQRQIDLVINNNENEHLAPSSPAFNADSELDEVTEKRILDATRKSVRNNIQAEYGVLSMREGWALLTQVRDAANQARLIAPASVREGIDALLRTTAPEELEAAVLANALVVDFRAEVETQKLALNELMNNDLLAQTTGVAL